MSIIYMHTVYVSFFTWFIVFMRPFVSEGKGAITTPIFTIIDGRFQDAGSKPY
jgi:hypothetical protein